MIKYAVKLLFIYSLAVLFMYNWLSISAGFTSVNQPTVDQMYTGPGHVRDLSFHGLCCLGGLLETVLPGY